jgi:hypothetical protein
VDAAPGLARLRHFKKIDAPAGAYNFVTGTAGGAIQNVELIVVVQ